MGVGNGGMGEDLRNDTLMELIDLLKGQDLMDLKDLVNAKLNNDINNELKSTKGGASVGFKHFLAEKNSTTTTKKPGKTTTTKSLTSVKPSFVTRTNQTNEKVIEDGSTITVLSVDEP